MADKSSDFSSDPQTGKIADSVGPSTRASLSGWLDEALGELAACPDVAVDEGLEKPSPAAIEKAEVLLKAVSRHVEDQPDIYPMDQGSIAVEFRSPEIEAGVLFLIEENGSGAYYSRTRKSKCRGKVEDAADLLSEGGLAEIRKVGIR